MTVNISVVFVNQPECVNEPLRGKLLKIRGHYAPSDGEEQCHKQEEDPNKVDIVVRNDHPEKVCRNLRDFPNITAWHH